MLGYTEMLLVLVPVSKVSVFIFNCQLQRCVQCVASWVSRSTVRYWISSVLALTQTLSNIHVNVASLIILILDYNDLV